MLVIIMKLCTVCIVITKLHYSFVQAEDGPYSGKLTDIDSGNRPDEIAEMRAADFKEDDFQQKSQNIRYDFTQPNQDWVFLLDRTEEVGEHVYVYEVMQFVKTYLRQAVNIHPNYTRVALVSFATDIEVEFDHISRSPIVECQAFNRGGLMEQVEYTTEHNQGSSDVYEEKEVAAFSEASRILAEGRKNRPGVSQTVWLATDAANLGRSGWNAQIWSGRLQNNSVTMYGVGVGDYLKMDQLCKLTSQPQDRYCRRYEDWMDALLHYDNVVKKMDTLTDTRGMGGWYQVHQSLCQQPCGEQGTSCYCEGLPNANATCLCSEEYHPEDFKCKKCDKGFFTLFGNQSCQACPEDLHDSDHSVRKQCTIEPVTLVSEPMSTFDQMQWAYIAVHVLLFTTASVGAILFCRCRYSPKHRDVDKQFSFDSSGSRSSSSSTYTQSYTENAQAAEVTPTTEDCQLRTLEPYSRYARTLPVDETLLRAKDNKQQKLTETIIKMHDDSCSSSEASSSSSNNSSNNLIKKKWSVYERITRSLQPSLQPSLPKKMTKLPRDPLTEPNNAILESNSDRVLRNEKKRKLVKSSKTKKESKHAAASNVLETASSTGLSKSGVWHTNPILHRSPRPTGSTDPATIAHFNGSRANGGTSSNHTTSNDRLNRSQIPGRTRAFNEKHPPIGQRTLMATGSKTFLEIREPMS